MDIISSIRKDISKIPYKKTKLFRDIAKSYKKEISQLDIESIYELCEYLLESKQTAETTIAYQIIYGAKEKYNDETFSVFEKWLHLYIKDWWDCDDFMTHAFQYVLMKYPENLKKLSKWLESSNFAVRRSASVILIRPAQKGLIDENDIFNVCNRSMNDTHYLVQKGYGWLLKESVKEYHDSVIYYLEKNVKKMSRTAFRYALEKLPKDEKKRLMLL